MEEMHRARYVGRGAERPCPLQAQVCHSPQISVCSATQKLLGYHTFKDYMVTFSLRPFQFFN